MIVAISYNTDIMAMENILPLTARWIKFAKRMKDLIIEIRTKSALFINSGYQSFKKYCFKLDTFTRNCMFKA